MQTKQITLTEQRLCKMWTATSYGGDWYELNKTLWEIAQVLRAEGMAEQTEVFAFCSAIALQRAVDETQKRKTLAVVPPVEEAAA